MKILALVTDAFGAPGGIACYNRDFLTALAAVAEVGKVNVLPRFGRPAAVNEKLLQLQGHRGKLRYSAAGVLEALRFRPDRVFCGHVFMLPLAALIGRLTGTPIWLQLHGIEAWDLQSTSMRRSLKQVDLVTCVSRYTRQKFLAWSNMDPAKVKVLPNTVSDHFVPLDRSAARAHWNLGNSPTLLTVGRLAPTERYKGHDRVLKCLPQLLASHPSLLYLVGGEGEDRARLEELADVLGVSESVRFLGKVPFDELPQLFNAADLFVMPSTGEGFGIVYLEAMACGTPALGLDADGSRDPLRDGDLGVVTADVALGRAIGEALVAGRPEGLSVRVREIFGPIAFARQVGLLLQQMGGVRGDATCVG